MFENPASLPAAPLPPTPGTPPTKPSMQAAPPENLPGGSEPEDMFDATEPVRSAASSSSMAGNSAPMPNAAPAVQPPMVTNRKTIVVASLVLGILILIGGGIALARFLGKPILGMNSATPSETVTETPTSTAPDNTIPTLTESPLARFNDSNTDTASGTVVTPPAETVVVPKDTDSDGLNDDEETVLGTDTAAPDTDKDGLSDYDEVRVYHTDPANADTDGDTFKDGDEVKNGYNPAGAGKLFGVPPQTDTTPSSTAPAPSTTPNR